MEENTLKQLLEKANNGDKSAQYELGEFYENKDVIKAEYWYGKAAEQNHLNAIYSLATLYDDGSRELKDMTKAFTLYLKCSEMRNVNDPDTDLAFSACKDIARFYEEGIVVDKNLKTAIEWYEKAAEGNILYPEDYETIISYYNGNEYGQQNYAKVAQYYVKSGNYPKAAEIYKDKLNDPARALYFSLYLKSHCYSLPYHEKIDYNHIEDDFKNYYLNSFTKDIQAYYKLRLFNNEPINFSESCYSSYRNEDKLKTDSIIHYHFFSLTTYFISLFPQVLGKILGYKYTKYFFMATGWPWLNCGMGGMLSPIDIIYESDLRPSKADMIDYLFIFDKVNDFMLNEFIEFIKGNQPNLNSTAYQLILERIKCIPSARKEIENECKIQFSFYMNWIINPSIAERPYLYVKYDGNE